MTLVMPRLLSAVAGYIARHGRMPRRVIVPVENWRAYLANPNSVPPHYNNDPTPRVLSCVELVPIPRQVYIAIGDGGSFYDYDENSPVAGAEAIIGDLLEGRDFRRRGAINHDAPSND
jgi:hypothetical protein